MSFQRKDNDEYITTNEYFPTEDLKLKLANPLE